MAEMEKGRIEQRRFERVVAQMNVRFYVLDEASGATVEQEQAYRETRLEQLTHGTQPETMLKGVTRDISAGGICLVADKALAVGTKVVVDMDVPGLPRPLRALGKVMRSGPAGGARDATQQVQLWHCGLEIIAIHKEDLRRIENFIIEQKLKGR